MQNTYNGQTIIVQNMYNGKNKPASNTKSQKRNGLKPQLKNKKQTKQNKTKRFKNHITQNKKHSTSRFITSIPFERSHITASTNILILLRGYGSGLTQKHTVLHYLQKEHLHAKWLLKNSQNCARSAQ